MFYLLKLLVNCSESMSKQNPSKILLHRRSIFLEKSIMKEYHSANNNLAWT